MCSPWPPPGRARCTPPPSRPRRAGAWATPDAGAASATPRRPRRWPAGRRWLSSGQSRLNASTINSRSSRLQRQAEHQCQPQVRRQREATGEDLGGQAPHQAPQRTAARRWPAPAPGTRSTWCRHRCRSSAPPAATPAPAAPRPAPASASRWPRHAAAAVRRAADRCGRRSSSWLWPRCRRAPAGKGAARGLRSSDWLRPSSMRTPLRLSPTRQAQAAHRRPGASVAWCAATCGSGSTMSLSSARPMVSGQRVHVDQRTPWPTASTTSACASRGATWPGVTAGSAFVFHPNPCR